MNTRTDGSLQEIREAIWLSHVNSPSMQKEIATVRDRYPDLSDEEVIIRANVEWHIKHEVCF